MEGPREEKQKINDWFLMNEYLIQQQQAQLEEMNATKVSRSLSASLASSAGDPWAGVIDRKRRAPEACASCRRNKRACSGTVPCERCIRLKLVCTFDVDRRRHVVPSVDHQHLVELLDDFEVTFGAWFKGYDRKGVTCVRKSSQQQFLLHSVLAFILRTKDGRTSEQGRHEREARSFVGSLIDTFTENVAFSFTMLALNYMGSDTVTSRHYARIAESISSIVGVENLKTVIWMLRLLTDKTFCCSDHKHFLEGLVATGTMTQAASSLAQRILESTRLLFQNAHQIAQIEFSVDPFLEAENLVNAGNFFVSSAVSNDVAMQILNATPALETAEEESHLVGPMSVLIARAWINRAVALASLKKIPESIQAITQGVSKMDIASPLGLGGLATALFMAVQLRDSTPSELLVTYTRLIKSAKVKYLSASNGYAWIARTQGLAVSPAGTDSSSCGSNDNKRTRFQNSGATNSASGGNYPTSVDKSATSKSAGMTVVLQRHSTNLKNNNASSSLSGSSSKKKDGRSTVTSNSTTRSKEAHKAMSEGGSSDGSEGGVRRRNGGGGGGGNNSGSSSNGNSSNGNSSNSNGTKTNARTSTASSSSINITLRSASSSNNASGSGNGNSSSGSSSNERNNDNDNDNAMNTATPVEKNSNKSNNNGSSSSNSVAASMSNNDNNTNNIENNKNNNNNNKAAPNPRSPSRKNVKHKRPHRSSGSSGSSASSTPHVRAGRSGLKISTLIDAMPVPSSANMHNIIPSGVVALPPSSTAGSHHSSRHHRPTTPNISVQQHLLQQQLGITLPLPPSSSSSSAPSYPFSAHSMTQQAQQQLPLPFNPMFQPHLQSPFLNNANAYPWPSMQQQQPPPQQPGRPFLPSYSSPFPHDSHFRYI